MKSFLLIAISIIAISCGQNHDNTGAKIIHDSKADYNPNPKSIELNNKALEITRFHQDDSTKIDSAILLLDKAIEIDSLYFLGYANKVRFLMIKNDFPRLLETNERIRELRPKQPKWIIQRAFILELSGDFEQANTKYQEGIKEYENMLSLETGLSWEFELEFAQGLVMANNYNRAQNIIDKLKNENPDLEIWRAFKLYTKDELLELIKDHKMIFSK